jgi:hypothetical protein
VRPQIYVKRFKPRPHLWKAINWTRALQIFAIIACFTATAANLWQLITREPLIVPLYFQTFPDKMPVLLDLEKKHAI